jgi:DNA-binding NtrC family response regulator
MGLKLLIADPNDDVRDALVRYFSQHGFDVRTADTAAGLNRELQCDPPQALLLEPEVLCGFVSGSAPSVPTVVLTRQRGTLPSLPEDFRVEQRYEKPARLEQVAESLRAAVRSVPKTRE